MFCSNCGQEGHRNFCTKCGKRLLEIKQTLDDRDSLPEKIECEKRDPVDIRYNTKIEKRYGVVSSFLMVAAILMFVMFFFGGEDDMGMLWLLLISFVIFAGPGLIMIYTRTPKEEIKETILSSCWEGTKAWAKVISAIFLIGFYINMNIGCKYFTAFIGGEKISVKRTTIPGYGNLEVYVDKEGNYYCK